jgi:hypothetical protein
MPRFFAKSYIGRSGKEIEGISKVWVFFLKAPVLETPDRAKISGPPTGLPP